MEGFQGLPSWAVSPLHTLMLHDQLYTHRKEGIQYSVKHEYARRRPSRRARARAGVSVANPQTSRQRLWKRIKTSKVLRTIAIAALTGLGYVSKGLLPKSLEAIIDTVGEYSMDIIEKSLERGDA